MKKGSIKELRQIILASIIVVAVLGFIFAAHGILLNGSASNFTIEEDLTQKINITINLTIGSGAGENSQNITTLNISFP